MEFARRARRTRPRPLDWVVGDARLRLRHAAETPPRESDDDALRRAFKEAATPGLRVLEVCDRRPIFAAEAEPRVDYSFLIPADQRLYKNDQQPFGCRYVGEPAALLPCGLTFDLVAWLRERDSLAQAVGVCERLMSPRGLLLLRTSDRFDGKTWNLENALSLPSGSRLLSLRRRQSAAAAA